MSARSDASALPTPADASARLRAARAALRITQRALGQRVGVSAASIRSWEVDHVIPRLEHRPALTAALGLDPAEMDALWSKPPDNIVALRPPSPGATAAAAPFAPASTAGPASVHTDAPELWAAVVKGIADGWASYEWWNRAVAAAAADLHIDWKLSP